ncbi:MAG: ATPase, partial [Caldanaerobacter sp.]
MNIFKILDDFEEMIKNSKRVPITGKLIVSEEAVLDFLDQIRTALPDELHQAKWLNKEKERVIQEAKEEAERILAEARQQASRMVNESE